MFIIDFVGRPFVGRRWTLTIKIQLVYAVVYNDHTMVIPSMRRMYGLVICQGYALTPPFSTPLALENCRQIHLWRFQGFSLGSPPEGR